MLTLQHKIKDIQVLMRDKANKKYGKWKNVDMEAFAKDQNVDELNNIDDDLECFI